MLRLPRSDRERRRWGTLLLDVLTERLTQGTPLLLVGHQGLDPDVTRRLMAAGIDYTLVPPDGVQIARFVTDREEPC